MLIRIALVLVMLFVALPIVGCGSEPEEPAVRSQEIDLDLEPEQEPAEEAPATKVLSSTPLPTYTPRPTQTPLPTHTTQPTNTPLPTATKELTATKTPKPTATDVPPTEPPPTDPPPTAAPPTEPPPIVAPPTQPPPTAVPPTAIPPTEPPPPTQPPAPTELPPPPVDSAPKILIIGVNKQAEYVDVQNAGGAAIDLGNWLLVSEKGSQGCFLGGVIQPGGVLRIWALAEDAGQGGFNCNFGSNIWNNSDHDPAVLYDPSGAEVSRR